MEKEKVSAKVIRGKITAVEGRKITVETKGVHGEWVPTEYELAHDSSLKPEDLIVYMDNYISIVIVNDKIYKIP